jgi:hypothetical protein
VTDKRPDCIVAFFPKIARTEESSQRRAYDVVLYVEQGFVSGEPSPANQARFAGRLDLGDRFRVLAIEDAWINFSRMNDAFAAYLQGESAASQLRELLELKVAVFEKVRGLGRTRVWLHLAARELEELPWELLASDSSDARTVFFRGLPSAVSPLFEISGALKCCFIASQEARQLPAQYAGDGAEVLQARRSVLERARDYDVVHFLTYAKVGPALETSLTLDDEDLPATHLARSLFGSRVGLLLLSAPPSGADPTSKQRVETYRAYMHLGQEDFQCSIIAPVGPLSTRATTFWRQFYQRLSLEHTVERALRAARSQVPGAPVCFFLRHRTSSVFLPRSTGPESATPDQYRGTGSLAAQHTILKHALESLSQVSTLATPEFRKAMDGVRDKLSGIQGQLAASDDAEEEE